MFRGDLGRSWAAMKLAPSLVVTTAVLAAGERLARVIAVTHPNVRGFMTLIGVALVLVTVGFYGAQRFWLDAAFRGQPFSVGDAALQTRRCFGRLAALGLAVTLAALPVVLVAAAINAASTIVARVIYLALTYAIDVILTFVVPALALSTTSVRKAFAIRRRIVDTTGRESIWYRFAPGIALLGLVYLLPDTTSFAVLSVTLSMLTALIALWFKGAILAFYLRAVPAGDGGIR
jgi:hypothetical protein